MLKGLKEYKNPEGGIIFKVAMVIMVKSKNQKNFFLHVNFVFFIDKKKNFLI